VTEFGMFAYPWDIEVAGAESFVGRLRELGVDRLYVATCYHSAEVIVPMRRRNVVINAEPNVAHLPLPVGSFRDLAVPSGSLATTAPLLFPTLAAAARSEGLQLSAWTIAFHNSDLARSAPDAAIENCFGDRFAHGLCPVNPRSSMLAIDMVSALVKTGWFDSVMVESLSFLLFGHGHPHELWGVRLDPLTRYLLSICFCRDCLELGARHSTDGAALRTAVADELHRTWNHPLSIHRNPDDGTELAARLVLDEDLAAWTRMRCDAVTDLASKIAAVTTARGVELELSSAIWGRPASLNWTEGIDIRASARTADRFVLGSYYPDAGDVARELDHVLAFTSPDRVAMVQTLWPEHHGSLAGLLEKIDLALTAGVGSVSLYNFAMASEPLIEWIRAVAQRVHDHGGST